MSWQHRLSLHWIRLKKSSFTRGLAILTSASLLQNLITFGSAPVIARLFTPEQFGVAGLIQSSSIVLIPLATGQYFVALGIARNRSESINIAFLSIFLIPIFAALVLPLVLYFAANPQILPTSFAGVAIYLWTIPAFVIAGGLLFVSRLWEIRHAHYGSQVVNRLIESGGIALAQIGLGLLGVGALGLILGRWLGIVAATTHGIGLILAQIGRRGLRAISLRRICALAVRHWRFPAFQLPAQTLARLTEQSLPLLLGLFYALPAVGFYWFANRLLERPAIVLGDNVGRVYYQHAADLRKEARPVSPLFWQSTTMLAAMAIIPFGIVILYGPSLFALIFGAEWTMAGRYARWIALANFAMLLAIPARGSTALFGLQGAYAIIEAARAIASTLAVIVIARTGGHELLAIGVAAIAQSTIMIGFIGFVGVHLLRLDQARSPRSNAH